MAAALLHLVSPSKLSPLAQFPSEQQRTQAFERAQEALMRALHHLRDSDSNVMHAMANTRQALEAIQAMRETLA